MQSLLTRWVWPCGWAQSVNNYEKEVYNGDPGYITSVDPQARSVTVQYPCSSAGEPWPPRSHPLQLCSCKLRCLLFLGNSHATLPHMM